ncbi:DoxX family protein [Mucilaginibacter myungsuensis]|uniref:DoxX-like protein n=1 Tax=Mucilaginibacter myungsuensis TaxID=649104 RepID=A0A929KZ07_9SPHI|nr:hypothetical protein [Mucilaginibacter myungsuensis]MBE9662543.1 hypothetical protein [Mucilaginibacter myungsuensis]MDN3597962.1 hypothetical protein [Mucilaginibacter myungsuensis]
MKPLIVLFVVFGIACAVTFFTVGHVDLMLSGRIAMAVMLQFTAMGHFKFADGMAMMLPPVIPFKKPMIWATGVIEIAAAVGLLTSLYQMTGKLLIVFFILLTPANIYAATKKVNLEKANYEGDGLNYLWFRIPLQVLFIWWVWYFAIAP